ncbi:MAG TPA: hypothetical protein VIY48_19965 [Candidatus Paceibacterota bacterium]
MAKTTKYGPDPQDMTGFAKKAFSKASDLAQVGLPGMAAVKAGKYVGDAISGIKGGSGSAPLGRGGPRILSSASADDTAPNLGGRSGMGKRAGTPAKVSPAGASSGSITKPDKASQAANKARGDAYLANNSSTDYGLGSAVNDFVNKKKR